MFAQRVANEAMLSLTCARGPSSQPPTDAVTEFEAALGELERAPPSSDLIRAALAAARDDTLRQPVERDHADAAATARGAGCRSPSAQRDINDANSLAARRPGAALVVAVGQALSPDPAAYNARR
jgi:hypothetical protein